MKLEQIEKIAVEIFSQKDEVIIVYLYGSFLRSHFYNDLDIGILIKEEFESDLFYETGIARQFEKKLKINMDLRVLNEAPLRFLFNVLQNSKILFCRDEHRRIEFEAKIMKEYLDLKPHHDLYEEMRGMKYATR